MVLKRYLDTTQDTSVLHSTNHYCLKCYERIPTMVEYYLYQTEITNQY